MTIPLAPTVPNPNSVTFGTDAYPFTQWMAALGPAIDSATAIASNAAATATAAAIGTLAASGTSTDSLTVSTGSKTFTTQTGKAFAVGQSMKWAMQSDAANYFTGLVDTYNSTNGSITITADATGGTGTSALWEGVLLKPANVAPGIALNVKTAAYTAVKADQDSIIDCSGTWTLGFSAAATLGNGWWCYVRNSGTGDITLDSNAAELIDGLASFVMYPGEVRLVQCDGTTLSSIVLCAFSRTYPASGTFIKPPGYKQFEGLLWGAGASGYTQNAATRTNTANYGGAPAACIPFALCAAAIGVTESVTIGAGGVGTTAVFNGTAVSVAGGNSVFASITGYGGVGGSSRVGGSGTMGGGLTTGAGGSPAGGAGTTSTTNDSTFGGGGHGVVGVSTANFGIVGGNSVYGGAGGAGAYGDATNITTVGTAGNSVYGGTAGQSLYFRGSTASPSTAAVGTSTFGGAGGLAASGVGAQIGGDGAARGGGGGAAYSSTSTAKGGTGGRGEMVIWGVL